MQRKRVFSGVQPTGALHLGNYVGALSLWAERQAENDNIFCIVDLHALTIPEAVKPEELRRKCREIAALYLACGIDPRQSAVFVQSHVREHSELTWILNCVTPLGWLEKMTQFKSKAGQRGSAGAGLLDYPVLQAADILLYQTDLVPVGEDQRQHIELCRNIAQRFEHLFGVAFRLPEPLIRAAGARVMGLDSPENKMSKSLAETQPGHALGLLDSEKKLRKAVMGAKTDAGNSARFDSASPGVLNLLTIYEVLTGESRAEIEVRFDGQGYGTLKKAVFETVWRTLEPIQKRYVEFTQDAGELERVLKDGADRARAIAADTMDRVRKLVGLA